MNNLTSKQKEAINLLEKGENVFLTGSAGVGKSHIIKYFFNKYKNIKKIALTSTTGFSSLLIGGSTIHSYLGLGVGKDSTKNLMTKILRRNIITDRWRKLDCLIIDEISCLDPILFDRIENLGRLLRRVNKPFGGLQIILSGDFLQLPPVGCEKFCFESESWKFISKTIYLTEIIRQKNNKFQNILNKIRLGDIDAEVVETLDERVCCEFKNQNDILPTRIYSKNYKVDIHNNRELDKLSLDGRDFYEYKMDITILNKKIKVENIIKNINAPQYLQLCKDAQVMLTVNLDLSKGLANGSRGIILYFDEFDKPVVKFMNGEIRTIEYYLWEIEENNSIQYSVEQLPLKVAYAISIHKSQGCSIDFAEIDISDIFEYGQSYVALSRVKNLEGLNIINIDYDKIVANPKAIEYYNNIQ